ncbi:nonstructural protein [Microviridae sp.]|nr:nonstructural protein [Microviridae sp.]
MTTKILFTVYDSKSESYLAPFSYKTTGEAVRSFTDVVNDPNTAFNKHPEDFVLYKVGGFSEVSGSVFPLDPHVCLGKAIDFVK